MEALLVRKSKAFLQILQDNANGHYRQEVESVYNFIDTVKLPNFLKV